VLWRKQPTYCPKFNTCKSKLVTYKTDQALYKKASLLSDYLWSTSDNKNIETIKEFYIQREELNKI
jgi:hypothetical protein